jgi:hypothetical protein
MNEAKEKKTKRSVSKNTLVGKRKESKKTLNDSLFEETKYFKSCGKEREMLTARKEETSRKRSISKDSTTHIKGVKPSLRIPEKRSKKQMNDEYQLGLDRCPIRKRMKSNASCASRDLNKTKLSSRKVME